MHLERADEQQKSARDRLSYQAWGGRLSPPQFVQREQRLRAHPFARASLTSWLLMGDDGATLASCETYRMQSYWNGAAGTSFGVASVFCEPALRGRGYASRLMALVGDEMAGAQAAILFSDVGAKLYERAGYVARLAGDLAIAPADGDPAATVDALLDERELAGALTGVAVPAGGFVVWPTAAQLDWHLERSRTYSAMLGRPRPPHCGARAGRSILFWAGDLWKDRLQILLLAAEDASAAAALIEAARREAARTGLREVRLWLDPGRSVPAFAGSSPSPREGALAMIRPLAPGLAPTDWTTIPRAIWV